MADSPQNLPNPVIKESDAEGAELLAAAAKADQEGFAPSAEAPAPPTPLIPPTKEPDQFKEPTEVEPGAKTEPQRDELGRFTKADGTKSEPGEAAPTTKSVETGSKPVDGKTDTEYVKAKKEAERRDRSWKALEEEKARIRRDQEQFEAQRRAFEQQRLAPKPDTFSSTQYEEARKDYRRLAREARARGEYDVAEGHEDLAEKAEIARDKAREAEQQQQLEHQKGSFQQIWQTNANRVIAEVPDLGNPETEASKEMVQLLKDEPILNFHPDGLRKGYEILQMRKKAARTDELEQQNKKLTAELERYQKLTAVGGDSPTSVTGPKKFEDMSLEEMGPYLARQSELQGGIAA